MRWVSLLGIVVLVGAFVGFGARAMFVLRGRAREKVFGEGVI